MAFDPDAFLNSYGKEEKPKAAPVQEFNPEAFLADFDKEQAAQSPTQDQPRAKKTPAQIKYEQEQGQTPEPGFLDKVGAALDPGEIWNDATAGAGRGLDSASFGAVPYIVEKLGGQTREEQRAFNESRAGTELGGNLAGMGVAGASGIGAPFVTAGKNLVAPVANAFSKIAPSTTRTVGAALPSARPIAEAATSGGLFGATDAAVRGGDAGDVAKAAGVGALVGGGMSALPPIAGKVEDIAHRAVLNRSVKPITDVAKGKVDKALSQFGGGKGIEQGEKALKEFVDKENLQPVLRAKGANMEEQFQARKEAVWTDRLEPIYQKAYAAEPNASVPLKEITGKLKSMIAPDQRGTSRSDLINAYVKQIEGIAEAEKFGQNYPVRNLINKARDLQGRGHSGVVNYDSPTENKEIEREVGRALRELGNDRVGKIFAKNPKVAAEILGRSPAEMKRPKDLLAGMENPDVVAVGEQFRAGNKTYSDYAKLDPLVDQAAKNQARDRQPFDVRDRLRLGGAASTLGLVGGAVGGWPGAAVGTGLTLAGAKAAPYLERGLERAAGSVAGQAFNPLAMPANQNLSKAQLAEMLGSLVGIEALKDYVRSKGKKK